MNLCELNKFIDVDGGMDTYRFDPINEKATIFKGKESVVIDLNLSVGDQLSAFQLFLDGLDNGD